MNKQERRFIRIIFYIYCAIIGAIPTMKGYDVHDIMFYAIFIPFVLLGIVVSEWVLPWLYKRLSKEKN
jgi:hypothetical protein